ncbi:MAG: dihydroorotase [Burkholderiaceae bacterium]|nr:dihydroorotase [Burkholderiaceae bacterium]
MTAIQTLTLSRPDDFHLHLRDGAALRDALPWTARQFARAIVMPNLKPPVVRLQQALDYRQRILAALPAGSDFTPLMTLYLTDDTTPEMVQEAKASGAVHAFKLYPAGATTNSDSGVTELKRIYPALDAMQRVGMPLLIHGEVTDADVDVFDREAVFIDRHLIALHRAFPELKIVLEHITTAHAAAYVREACGLDAQGVPLLAATITAHHLLHNRNAMFKGGMRPHYYCLPVLKRETHRQALLDAATSGDARFFLGTDSAPHARNTKEAACGCAGCFTAANALELYCAAFEQRDALHRLDDFASRFGAAFYGLPRNAGSITLERASWSVPDRLPYAESDIVPLHAGEAMEWRLRTADAA